MKTAPESYVHRIGRTGQPHGQGVALTLAEPREHRLLRNIEQLTRKKIEDRFSLVEVSNQIAEGALCALRSTSLRGQRVAARRDQPKRSTKQAARSPTLRAFDARGRR